MVLAAQIVLMRMFSIAQWHHFAAMIIGIALLGFGLSGTILSLWRERLRRRFGLCALGFAVSLPVCIWAAQEIPFTPLLIVWQPRQLWWLFAVYAVLLVPFTFAALAIGIALAKACDEHRVGQLYAVNLFGSAAGALGGLALCFLPLPVRISEFKALRSALVMAGARTVWTAHHPLGRVDVVESSALRVAPGLSLAYTGPMPTQQVLFVDADGGSAMNRGDTAYLEWLTSAAAYQVRRPDSVLVIGAGGGAELQQARRFGAKRVTGVEMHPRIASLTGAQVAEGRAFIRRSRERYDVIEISLLDSIATSATGIGAANEMYLYTTEALREFVAHLADDGVLCITRWLKTPPRDELRLFATAVAALGADEPASHLMFVRGWATGTLLVKRSAFTSDEIARLRRWADGRLFDVDYFPRVTLADVNRHNVMPEPTYFLAAQRILSGNLEYLFDIRPATDDRPYFFHFFRWKTAPHLLRTMGREWLPFVEWGYVVAVATLVQAALASVVLIGLPALRRHGGEVTGRRWPVVVYFACIGVGFMFVEMVMIQKLTLLLGHPLYAASAVITTMLLLAGLGSMLAGQRVTEARWPALGIVLMAGICGLGRAEVFAVLLAPMALGMGTMFPVGLSRVAPPLVPWAWAVNGCCSVVGALLGSVLAMDFGFSVAMFMAGGLYACAGATFACLGG